MRVLLLQIACVWLAAAASLPGQSTALQIDPAQTKIEFTLGAVMHTVHGTFALKHGDIRFDPSTGQASGQLVVDATSAQSGNDSRDKKMHKSILESDRYPEITFRPDRVDGKVPTQGTATVQLHGMFGIHGAEHEMTLPVQVEATGSQYNATLQFQVPYLQWGMKNPSTLFLRVSEKVDITIHTVALPAK